MRPRLTLLGPLDQLPAGALQQLAHLLTHATNLRQVARGILADLQDHLEGRPTEPTASPPTPPGPTPTP
jgi:hypothetical protein